MAEAQSIILYGLSIYSPINERMPKRQERYHIHLHIRASQVFKKSSFLENKKQRNFKFRQVNQELLVLGDV